MIPPALFMAGAAGIILWCAAADLLTMTIPNRAVVALVVGFGLAAITVGMTPSAFLMHLAAGGLVLTAGLVCFAGGWIGGGDVKLAAVIALWLGWSGLPGFALLTVLFGGVLAAGAVAFRHRAPSTVSPRHPAAGGPGAQGSEIPYGLALGASALVLLPAANWLQPIAS